MKPHASLWSTLFACFVAPCFSFVIDRGRLVSPSSRRSTDSYQAVCLSPSTLHSYTDTREAKDERTVVILYNKPPNIVTSHSNADTAPSGTDVKQRRTVYQDIETFQGCIEEDISSLSQLGIHSKLHAIGRLDADTTGLLLLTNDGGLVHHATNPTTMTSSICKTYEATVMGYWEDSSPVFQEMRLRGVDIGTKYGGQTKPPASLRVLDHPTHKSTRVEITLAEGRNRQVRRMFHAIQSGVMKLERTSIASIENNNTLTCGDLKQGQWRVLTDKEVEFYLDWKPRVTTTKNDTSGRPSRTKRKRRPSSRHRKRSKH